MDTCGVVKHIQVLGNMNELPFIQENISDTIKIRTFTEDTDSGELMWHRDRENRLVEILESNGWKYQSDNSLPIEMKKGDKIFIPEGLYHRVIKGSGDLTIKLELVPHQSQSYIY